MKTRVEKRYVINELKYNPGSYIPVQDCNFASEEEAVKAIKSLEPGTYVVLPTYISTRYEVPFKEGHVPSVIKRVSDGRTLALDYNSLTYMYEDIRSAASSGWSFGRLFNDYRCYGDFEVVEWIEHEEPEKVIKLGYDEI